MRYEKRGTLDNQEERERLFSKKGIKGEHYRGSVSAIG